MLRSTMLACAGLTAVALAATPAAMAGPLPAVEKAVGGLDGARGLDIGESGKTVVATADGSVIRVFRSGPRAGERNTIAKLPASFLAPAVAVANDNAVWMLTVGAEGVTPGQGSLWLKEPGTKKRVVVNVQQWLDEHEAGVDPYDLEGAPHESNPYGVAALPGGSALVADAANNAVLKVTRAGKVSVVARVKPRMIDTPDFMDDPSTADDDMMPTEAVTTSVAVGPDGSVYVGELRGFPGTPGTSQVWRVAPGEKNAVCDPAEPTEGSCTRVADGLTSIVALETGRGGAIYVAEMSKLGWPATEPPEGEEPDPAAFVGSVIRLGHHREMRTELSAGEVILPGAVAVGGAGNVFVSGPIFGPGGFMRVS